MSRDFRILVLGDAKAGKTSLISAFLKEEPISSSCDPSDRPCTRLPAVSVPSVYGSSLYIVDGSSSDETEPKLTKWRKNQVGKADAVVLAYNYTSDSFARLETHWLPYLRKATEENTSKRNRKQHLPIILVACKQDLHNTEVADNIAGLRVQFPEIEGHVNTSSVNYSNVAEVFWQAQQAVLYPSYPLYDATSRSFRPSVQTAFHRVFQLLSRGTALIDAEGLAEVQKRVFGTSLTTEDVHDLVEQTPPQSASISNSIDHQMLDLPAWLGLMNRFMECDRGENVWKILRFYGYDDNVELSESYLYPKLPGRTDGTDVLEYSDEGWAFIEALYDRYSPDITDTEHTKDILQDLTPRLPWFASSDDLITKELWSAVWARLAFVDAKIASAYLGILGFPQSGLAPDKRPKIAVSRSSALAFKACKARQNRKMTSQRRMFGCLVYGRKECLKRFTETCGEHVIMDNGRYASFQLVSDPSQISSRKLASADLAIYVYTDDEDAQNKTYASSIDYLVDIREGAHQKLIEAPNLVLAFLQEGEEESESERIARTIPQELADFCHASSMGSPLILNGKNAKAALKIHLEKVLLKGAPQSRSSSGSESFSSWLVWSSALAATCAIGYILLQRTGWLQVHSSTAYSHSFVKQGADRVRPIF